MVSVRLLTTAIAAIATGTAAYAADMPQQLPPPPQMTYQPPLMVMAQPEGAWYLRGFIGVGSSSEADFVYQPSTPIDVVAQHAELGDSTFFGGGIGYEFNNWLRFDVTA
ncbi:MAG: porin family protein, partial [Xanthobacteraceae bacterium]